MKGIVLAGGKGTRLYPLTEHFAKPLITVFGEPMIFHTIRTLVSGGVDQILILSDNEFLDDVRKVLEDSDFKYSVPLDYLHKAGGPQGTAAILAVAEQWVEGEDFALIACDSIIGVPLDFAGAKAPHIWAVPKSLEEAKRYGQIRVEGNQVVELVEKKDPPISNLAQVAAWKYPADIFSRLKRLQPTGRRELEATDALARYVSEGSVTCTILPAGSYSDAGTHAGLAEGEEILKTKLLH